jgi:hypothetical protein
MNGEVEIYFPSSRIGRIRCSGNGRIYEFNKVDWTSSADPGVGTQVTFTADGDRAIHVQPQSSTAPGSDVEPPKTNAPSLGEGLQFELPGSGSFLAIWYIGLAVEFYFDFSYEGDPITYIPTLILGIFLLTRLYKIWKVLNRFEGGMTARTAVCWVLIPAISIIGWPKVILKWGSGFNALASLRFPGVPLISKGLLYSTAIGTSVSAVFFLGTTQIDKMMERGTEIPDSFWLSALLIILAVQVVLIPLFFHEALRRAHFLEQQH